MRYATRNRFLEIVFQFALAKSARKKFQTDYGNEITNAMPFDRTSW